MSKSKQKPELKQWDPDQSVTGWAINHPEAMDAAEVLYFKYDAEKVSDKVDDECWLYNGLMSGNYGDLRIKVEGRGVNVSVHRLSWRIENGPIPKGGRIKQKCGIKHCIKPGHLYLVNKFEEEDEKESTLTVSVQSKDGKLKEVVKAGPKLTDKKGNKLVGTRYFTVARIKNISDLYYNKGMQVNDIARKYEMSPWEVYLVVTGKYTTVTGLGNGNLK